VLKQKNIVDANVAVILEASKVCYDTPVRCFDKVREIALTDVDVKAFLLPDLPVASYRLLTTGRGLWSREDSIAQMTSGLTDDPTEHTKVLLQDVGKSGCNLVAQAGLGSYDCFISDSEGAFFDLNKIGDGETSVVLHVTGVGLDQAFLMFENTQLAAFPLTKEGGSDPGKSGENYAYVVTDSTRGNPGWRDINVSQEREKLQKDQLPKADGVFYLVVKDVFGRRVRFDIEYDDWDVEVATNNPGNTCSIRGNLLSKSRRWDKNSDGTSVVGTLPFTEATRSVWSTIRPLKNGPCK
jgi:hypothetical protein